MDLAIKILDGAPLRPADKLLMSVSRAKFEQKGEHCCTFVVYLARLRVMLIHPSLGFGLDNILLMVLIGFYFFFFFFFHSGERFITKQTDNKKKKKLKKVEQKLLGWGKFSLFCTRNLPLSLERHRIEKDARRWMLEIHFRTIVGKFIVKVLISFTRERKMYMCSIYFTKFFVEFSKLNQ